MITVDYVRTMAAYNAWRNSSVVGEVDQLSDGQRRADQGAFFGSIFETLNHVLWADEMWLHRLTGREAPAGKTVAESLRHTDDWEGFKGRRDQIDQDIIAWADNLTADDFSGDLKWFSGGVQRHLEQPRWVLIVHFFNHQTHHRGQVHCLLTQAGVKTDDTDIPIMPGVVNFVDG